LIIAADNGNKKWRPEIFFIYTFFTSKKILGGTFIYIAKSLEVYAKKKRKSQKNIFLNSKNNRETVIGYTYCADFIYLCTLKHLLQLVESNLPIFLFGLH
jgi:hypothetical protein